MDNLQSFAEEARLFGDWAEGKTPTAPMNPKEALTRLISIYRAALDLPAHWTENLSSKDTEPTYTLDGFNMVYSNASHLPFRNYSEVFDPFADPQDGPIFADICADLAEVYEDIIRDLRLYDAGNVAEARYKWGWSFQYHWGEHATSAIRALHIYLSQNDPDKLVNHA